MLLALDVGNTQTVIGVFGDLAPRPAPAPRAPGELPGLAHSWRVSTVLERTADEHALLIQELLGLVGLAIAPGPGRGGGLIEGIAISSSVPSVTGALREMAARWFTVPTVVVEPGIRTGMPVLYDNPKEVGADRIVNAVAALDLFGGPAIVVDLGTATTFDAISAKGEYLGGVIAPGIEISMDALFAHAAALRRVELVAPRSVIGRSSIESMQAGAIFGHAGLVDGVCRRIEAELGPCAVIATGGLGGLVAPHAETVAHYEPWLTLHGLQILYARNALEVER